MLVVLFVPAMVYRQGKKAVERGRRNVLRIAKNLHLFTVHSYSS